MEMEEYATEYIELQLNPSKCFLIVMNHYKND